MSRHALAIREENPAAGQAQKNRSANKPPTPSSPEPDRRPPRRHRDNRGPNVDGVPSSIKLFPVPNFTPQIGVFRKVGSQLVKEQTILLKNVADEPLTGLPNPAGVGGTGETAQDLDGHDLGLDEDGLDPEGLVALADGTFWISDEYGPHLLHVDASGKTLERINPFGSGTGGRKIPLVFANRRANRGMEGLTITPDGKKLVGMMQSPLDNPTSARTAIRAHSRVTRVLVFDLATGNTQQYVYFLDHPGTANSEIRALSNTEFVVLERDGAFPNDPASPAKIKRFYKIDLTGATDISDPANGALGLTFTVNGQVKTIEQMTALEVLDAGIVPANKELYLDLLLALPDAYPHDKPEGFAILPDGSLAIINDDDFGILSDGQGGMIPKILPATGQVDHNILYLVKPTPVVARGFKLQIIHSSDNESSFVDPNTLEPKLLNYAAVTRGLQELAAREGWASLHLTAGDHTLPGPFYQAAAEVPSLGARGLGDIALYNALGVVANGMGNHEFDGGINDFARLLAHAHYPFIAANLDFSNVQLSNGVPAIRLGVDGGSVVENAGKVVKSAWIEVGGQKIGLIGRAPADFFNVIANPSVTLPGLDFVGGRNPTNHQPLLSALPQVLAQVDLLKAQGINKIILVDHAQDFTGDPLSAQNLRDIDIVVAAGSTGFMAKNSPTGPFNLLRPEDQPGAAYPTIRADGQTNPVLVVNSDQLYRYAGNLMVRFNDQGIIEEIDGRSGPIATTATAIAALSTELLVPTLTASPAVRQIMDALTATPLIQDRFTVAGTTAQPLNGQRAHVRSRETNLGRLAADSTLWYARQYLASLGLNRTVDIALKNGGGIRDSITGPTIIKLTIGAALAFNNQLAILDLNGAELLAVAENAISRHPALDGRFPQIAGLDLEFDPTRPGVSDAARLTEPSRVSRLVVHRANGTSVTLVRDFRVVGDLTQMFGIALNNFLLTGGDGYAAFKAINQDPTRSPGILLPPVGEQQILADYIAGPLGGAVVNLPDPPRDPRMTHLQALAEVGDVQTGLYLESAAEIVTYDPLTRRAFVSNAARNGVDILDLSDPTHPRRLASLHDLGGNVNSVDVKNGIVAIAVENPNPQLNGSVLFIDSFFGMELNRLEVGPMPDMVTFTPDGTKVLTANEGEPNADYTVDPEGSVSIIDLGRGTFIDVVRATQANVHRVGFAPYNFLDDLFRRAGIRIYGRINHPATGAFLRPATLAEDFEPEYIAVSPNGKRAYVTLQENNALAIIDLASHQLLDIVPFGYKDHRTPGQGLDASDRDSGISIRNWPVFGMYLPDGIAAFETLGQTFLITANEGDARDYDGFSEEARVANLNLDPTAFPDAADLQKNANLGRLKTTTALGDTDGDGDFDRIYAYGGRSFSIWDESGRLVWDSGDQIEHITAQLFPSDFNSNHEENDSFDSRSDDKGPEPESVTVGQIGQRLYAFVGLERMGGVLIYDVTYPYAPAFVSYQTTRNFSARFAGDTPTAAELAAMGDLGPEGLRFIPAADSPTGEPLLLIANEVSGNTSLHAITIPRAVEYKLQVLHSSDNESSFQDPNTLEPKILNYGAVISGLHALSASEGIPSIYVTAGDHSLPGPFYQAAQQVPSLGARGLADIAFYNAMGLVANGMGNHEFDGGLDDFARMVHQTHYPFLAVNLDFSRARTGAGVPAIERGVDGGSVQENAGKVVRSAYVEAGGERIGIIGRAPADFFNVIANPTATLPGLDFVGGRNPSNNLPLVSAVGQVLEQVALLEAKGINKIILLDHAQDFTSDPLDPALLRGIDIIVTAGSTGFFANGTPIGPHNLLRPGDAPTRAYPQVQADAAGNQVLIVNSDHLYRYVGNLIVSFNQAGRITAVDHRSGPVATTPAAIEAFHHLYHIPIMPSETVEDLFAELQGTALIQDLFALVGNTESPLQGLRAAVRTRETNLGRLAADSTLWYARRYLANSGSQVKVDIALKNGGGIRDSIQGPNILNLQVGAALAFNNSLGIIQLSAAELIATMENGVSRYPSADGRFPQIAGIYAEFDDRKPGLSGLVSVTTPSRIKTLIVHRADGTDDVVVENYEAKGDLNRRFTLATNNFQLTGGDGYAAFPVAAADPSRALFAPAAGEQQILKDYIQQALGGEVDLPDPPANPRIVRYLPTVTFAAWQARYFNPNQTGSGLDEDFDLDGLRNGTEYAHGLNPTVADHARNLVAASVEGDTLVVSHTRLANSGLTWSYDATPALGGQVWTVLAPGADYQVTIVPQGDIEMVTLRIPLQGQEHLFVRVRAH